MEGGRERERERERDTGRVFWLRAILIRKALAVDNKIPHPIERKPVS